LPGVVTVRRDGVRCRLVVAGAGYGKTTALFRWYPGVATTWHRGFDPGWLAELAAGGKPAGVRQVVVDDIPRLGPDEERALLGAVAELSESVSVALASRWPRAWPVASRPGAVAPVQARPADLALSVDEVADLLATEYEVRAAGAAERLHEATAGWPALVRLGAEQLVAYGVPAGPLLPTIAEPGGPLATYVVEEVPALRVDGG
jgi:ATP/maltotriose-dependent transcriptional regulator MalT